MKRDESQNEDSVYKACITWDLPALRNSGREDVKQFRRAIQLFPDGLNEGVADSSTALTPLQRAANGLKAELTGKLNEALENYEGAAEENGLPGLLGALLIAWTPNARKEHFDQVELKLDQLVDAELNDIVARTHCKLSVWALDHGWRDRSKYHFEEALHHSGNELTPALDRVKHWYGQNLVVREHKPSAMTTFPWIDERIASATRDFIEKGLRDSIKSPYSRRWSLGMHSVEGLDIQSAEMQASWAGAIWKLPEINRLHAALILGNSKKSDDVARAIALWVKGSGRDARALVSAKEPLLTKDSVEDLLLNQLDSGRNVRDYEIWLDLLQALWAELPDQFVENFVNEYRGPSTATRPTIDTGSNELKLVGKLLVRSAAAVDKAFALDDWQAGLLARSLQPGLIEHLPRRLVERLLAAGMSETVVADNDWSETGWNALLTCWSLAGSEVKDKFRHLMIRTLPDSSISIAAAVAPDLLPSQYLIDRIELVAQRLAKDLEDSRKGTFTGWGPSPAAELANLSIKHGDISDANVQKLVAVASATTTNSLQRRSCLAALIALAQEKLLDLSQVESTFLPVTTRPFMTDDVDTDQRLEDALRLILKVQFEYDHSNVEAPLLAASRDSDTEIRILAVEAVSNLLLQGHPSPSFEATLLGALYDPDPKVQARAVPAILHGQFDDNSLLFVARKRLVEIFPLAHRELRATIARQATGFLADEPSTTSIQEMAANDRSWVVRHSIQNDDR